MNDDASTLRAIDTDLRLVITAATAPGTVTITLPDGRSGEFLTASLARALVQADRKDL